jgi:hypothetical protein
LASSNNSNVPAYSFLQDSNSGLYWASNQTIGLSTGGVSRLQIVGSNVGIGVINPLYSLDLGNTGTINSLTTNFTSNAAVYASNISITSSNSLYPQAIFASNTAVYASNIAIYASNLAITSSNALFTSAVFSSNTSVYASNKVSVNYWSNNSSNVFTNSNLGIGTSSPAYNFDLYGSARITNALYTSCINTTGTGDNEYLQIVQSNQTTGSNCIYLEAAQGGYIGNCALSFNSFVFGNNQYQYYNSNKSRWSIIGAGYTGFDQMYYEYSPPNASQGNVSRFLVFSNVGSYASNGTPLIYTGINTETPAFQFDVNGIIHTNNSLIVTGVISSNALLVNTSNSSYMADIRGSLYVSSNIIVGPTTQNLALSNDASYQIIGGTTTQTYNGASFQLSGRNKSGGGVLSAICCDNGYINFSTVNNSGVGTEWMRMTNSGYLGINTTSPVFPLDIAGHVHSSCNIFSKSGTVGCSLVLNTGAIQMQSSGQAYSICLENGNTGVGGGCFTNGFLNGVDNSGLGLQFNKAYLLFRACRVGTGLAASSNQMILKCFNSNLGTYTNLTSPFWISDFGSSMGLCTNTSPIFSLPTSNLSAPNLCLQFLSPSNQTLTVSQCIINFLS